MFDLLGKLLTCAIQIFPTVACLDLAQSQPDFFHLCEEDRVKAFRILPSQDARSFLAQIRARWGSALFAD
jgi:hypothetical protein